MNTITRTEVKRWQVLPVLTATTAVAGLPSPAASLPSDASKGQQAPVRSAGAGRKEDPAPQRCEGLRRLEPPTRVHRFSLPHPKGEGRAEGPAGADEAIAQIVRGHD
jgi:hypothetical protein